MHVQVSVPGKLFLAGEYAVVETGQPALIASIDRFLTVTVKSSPQGSVYSSQQDKFVRWERLKEVISSKDDHTYDLIFSAMNVAEAYIRHLGIKTDGFYDLFVESQLDDELSGIKYGLGSSGAVTVATVKAVLAYYEIEAASFLIYQLSVLAQIKLGMLGSFGDLAAISHGGLIAYHSVDRDWLRQEVENHHFSEVLDQVWPGLSIERLSLPASISFLVGWTGRPSSTEALVAHVGQRVSQREKEVKHAAFVSRSKNCLDQIISSCQKGDALRFQEGIAENRRLLQEFARDMGLVIETPALQRLCQLAQEVGAVAKTSGAGGGDCGIAFVTKKEQADEIRLKWQEVGIVPLDFTLARKMK